MYKFLFIFLFIPSLVFSSASSVFVTSWYSTHIFKNNSKNYYDYYSYSKLLLSLYENSKKNCERLINNNLYYLVFVKSTIEGEAFRYYTFVYKIKSYKNNDDKIYGYVLYGKEEGQKPRVLIYEKTKEDFNRYCKNTPFYMDVVE